MPSPFTRRPMVTSDPVRDRQPITPVMESVDADVFPYRGTQTHGVEPTEKFLEPADYTDGRPVEYERAETPPDPIPVRIVSESGRELRQFRTVAMATGDNVNGARMVLGQDEERSSVRLKHITESAVVWVSHEYGSAGPINGYPLAEGDEWSSNAHTPIYAWVDSATAIPVYMSIEYATSVES
jgi:hypothetical protein